MTNASNILTVLSLYLHGVPNKVMLIIRKIYKNAVHEECWGVTIWSASLQNELVKLARTVVTLETERIILVQSLMFIMMMMMMMMMVAFVNKQLMSFQNYFGVLSWICQGKV